MAVNQYKDVAWGPSPEALDINKLNTMVDNTRYVFERLPKLFYNRFGLTRDAGVKIACGIGVIPANSQSYLQSIVVNFGSFFTPGCKPVITMSIQSPSHRRVLATFYGVDGYSTVPDHRGMGVTIAAVPNETTIHHLDNTMHLHWIAMGY